MRKTILIASFHPLISRNILATRLLDLLVEQGFQLVILAPQAKLEYFRTAFEREQVRVRGISYSFGAREKFLRYLSLAALDTVSLRTKRKTEMKGSGAVLTRFISNAFGIYLIRLLEKVTYRHTVFGTVFNEFKPVKVFSTDVQSEFDIALIHEAKKHGVPSAGMVRSWDNLTSKGLIRAIPDRLIVWNDIVKHEASDHHRIAESSICIVGIPHYDDYRTYELGDRSAFFKKIGGDPSKKLILVIPIGDRYMRNNTVDRDIVRILDKMLPDQYQIMVRLPPGDYVRELEHHKDEFDPKRFIFDRATLPFENIKMTEISKEDDIHLARTLKWSEMVVSGPSTLVIDAVFADKPTVLFGFDGYEKREYFDSIARYYDYTNFVPVIQSKGAPLAHDREELERMVHEYLADPGKDSAERKRLIKEQVSYTDGTCTARLADEIASGNL